MQSEAEVWQGAIERLAWGGLGIGRAADGRIVLLSSDGPIFPGEEVSAKVRWKKRHGEGQITEHHKRDPRFSTARFSEFSAAGYELWAAGDSAAELKRLMVEDLLTRSLPGQRWQWLPAPPDALRHRIQLHWDGKLLGYHRRGSNEVMPATNYPVAVAQIENAMRLMGIAMQMSLPPEPARWEIATGTPPGDLLVWRSERPGSAWLISEGGLSMSHNPLVHRLGSWQLRQSAGSFFQACPPWAWTAFSSLMRGWEIGGRKLYDLYGGVGFFTAMLAGAFEGYVLVESAGNSIADARANLAGMNVEITAADVDVWMPDGLGAAGDVILLDPPRTGLSENIAQKLLSAGAKSIVLIGCDGASFTRDAARLAQRWALKNLAVIDLFPYALPAEFVGLFVQA